jgi:hypothetical protein
MSLDIRIKSIDAQISYLKILRNSSKTLSPSRIYYKIIKLKEERHELLLLKIRREKLVKINKINND